MLRRSVRFILAIYFQALTVNVQEMKQGIGVDTHCVEPDMADSLCSTEKLV